MPLKSISLLINEENADVLKRHAVTWSPVYFTSLYRCQNFICTTNNLRSHTGCGRINNFRYLNWFSKRDSVVRTMSFVWRQTRVILTSKNRKHFDNLVSWFNNSSAELLFLERFWLFFFLTFILMGIDYLYNILLFCHSSYFRKFIKLSLIVWHEAIVTELSLCSLQFREAWRMIEIF